MALRFNESIQKNILDHPISGEREPFAHAASLFIYHAEAKYKRINYNLKYRGGIAMGRFFSSLLGEKLSLSPLFEDVDLVIPVPLHWLRRWRRGYNQAEIIASELTKSLEAPLNTTILLRKRRTRTQTKLSVSRKWDNVKDAFTLNPKLSHWGVNPTQIKHILVVDDVFTTGATLASCLAALRNYFPNDVKISVATLAMVDE